MKMKVNGREHEIDFSDIDLDGHVTLRQILGRPLRQAWLEVDWEDPAAAAAFLNDPLVIKALTWLAMRRDDPAVTPAQVGRLKFAAIEYAVGDEDGEAAAGPPEVAPPGQTGSAATGKRSGGNGSGILSPETTPAGSGGPS